MADDGQTDTETHRLLGLVYVNHFKSTDDFENKKGN